MCHDPYSGQEAPNAPRRQARVPSKSGQEAPKSDQKAPQNAQEASKSVHEASKSAQDESTSMTGPAIQIGAGHPDWDRPCHLDWDRPGASRPGRCISMFVDLCFRVIFSIPRSLLLFLLFIYVCVCVCILTGSDVGVANATDCVTRQLSNISSMKSSQWKHG